MTVRIGPFDPIQLVFNLMNNLMKSGHLSPDEARKILKESLDPQMPDEEKEKLLNTLMQKPNG